MREDLLKIIRNYGVSRQLKHFYTEVYEFTEAILEFRDDGNGYVDRSHIEEEYADLMVMLEQFKTYYDLDNDKIVDIMYKKIERQLDRISKESKENER